MSRFSVTSSFLLLQLCGNCIASRTKLSDQDSSVDLDFLTNSSTASVINPLERRDDLEIPWSPASIYAATLLSMKYLGSNEITPKKQIELILPKPGVPGALEFKMRLLATRPSLVKSKTRKMFKIWINDHPEDKTIYVIFKPIANPIPQLGSWFFIKTALSEACTEELIPGIREILKEEGYAGEMPKTHCFFSSMVSKFRTRPRLNFGDVLMQLLLEHPEHRVLFVGYSLGGPQAQAAALRFRMVDMKKVPSDMRHRLVWYPDGPGVLNENGPKWTDAAGAKLFQHYFGKRSLQLMSAMTVPGKDSVHERIYDGPPRVDTRLEPILPMKLLDFDDGKLFDCRPDGDPPCPTATDQRGVVFQTLKTTHSGERFMKMARCLGWPQDFPEICKAYAA